MGKSVPPGNTTSVTAGQGPAGIQTSPRYMLVLAGPTKDPPLHPLCHTHEEATKTVNASSEQGQETPKVAEPTLKCLRKSWHCLNQQHSVVLLLGGTGVKTVIQLGKKVLFAYADFGLGNLYSWH